MRIRVWLRTDTILLLLAKKDLPTGGRIWLARKIRVHPSFVSNLINRKEPVPSGLQSRITEAFRGMSHKPGGRLTWDDLFETQLVEGSTGAL